MLNIEPIKLLQGSHADTAQTGSGCFMNVIAYLNGEPQITDKSPCVCATIRPIAIWLNDYMRDDERHLLIPFIHRAMGTATNDLDILVRRARRAVLLATECTKSAAQSAEYAEYAEYAESAAANCAKYAAKSSNCAKYAANCDAEYAAECAEYAAKSAEYAAECANCAKYAARKQIIDSVLRYLDDVCPSADEPTQILIERANCLIELARV